MELDNGKIKAIYRELQGYLSQTPKPKSLSDIFATDSSWQRYNVSIEELSKVSGKDFSRFQIKPAMQDGYQIVHVEDYRQALNGLINTLHAQYFENEPQPFSGSPATVISQTQYQVQSVQMLLDFQSKIDKALQNVDKDSPQKKFLDKVKGSLSTVKDVTELFSLVLKLAKEFGLGLKDLISIFL